MMKLVIEFVAEARLLDSSCTISSTDYSRFVMNIGLAVKYTA